MRVKLFSFHEIIYLSLSLSALAPQTPADCTGGWQST